MMYFSPESPKAFTNTRVTGLLVTAVITIVILTQCGDADPDREANRLFVEAYRLSEEASKLEENDPVAAFEKYNRALQNIDKIIEDFPDTPVAVDATQQRTLIGDMSIGKLRLTVPRMKARASSLDDFHSLAKYLSGRHKEVQKAEHLIEYAGFLHRFDRRDLFDEIVSEVTDLADNHWNTEISDPVYNQLSGLYAGTGDWNNAIQMADQIQNLRLIRDAVEHMIAKGFVAERKEDAPGQLSDLISYLEPNNQLHVRTKLAVDLLESGNHDHAVNLISTGVPGVDEEGALERLETLNELVTILSRHGKFEIVAEIITAIDEIDEDYTGFALREKAVQLYRQGKQEEAMEIATSFGRDYFRHTSLSKIAVQRAETGRVSDALTLLDDIPGQLAEKTESRLQIAYILSDFGDYERSDSLIEISVPEIDALESSIDRARGHLTLADIYTMRNERSRAAGALENAERHARDISGSESMNAVTDEIFRLWADIGRPDRALDAATWFRMDHESFEDRVDELFRHAVERDFHDLAKSLAGITDRRAYFEYKLCLVYLDSGRTVRARQLAYEIRNFEWRTRAVADLSVELKRNDEVAASEKAATDALQMLNRIRDAERKEGTLLHVAKRLSASGLAMNEERKTLLKGLVGQLDH